MTSRGVLERINRAPLNTSSNSRDTSRNARNMVMQLSPSSTPPPYLQRIGRLYGPPVWCSGGPDLYVHIRATASGDWLMLHSIFNKFKGTMQAEYRCVLHEPATLVYGRLSGAGDLWPGRYLLFNCPRVSSCFGPDHSRLSRVMARVISSNNSSYVGLL